MEFRPPAEEHADWDVEIKIKNPNQPGRWNVEYGSYNCAYLPTAAIFALILATPLPWSRRWLAMTLGFVLVHLFIALRVAVVPLYVMYVGGAIQRSEAQVRVAGVVLEGFANSPVATFVVPVVIWLLVTFRRSDLEAVLPRSAAEEAG